MCRGEPACQQGHGGNAEHDWRRGGQREWPGDEAEGTTTTKQMSPAMP